MLEEVSLARDALQEELHVTKNALAAAEEHVQTTQAALAAEKDRVLKLEVELSEMQTKLQGMQELEVECRKYKQMLAERERKGAGIWGYVTGA
jgi:chromosome segregation ATPase